MQSIANFLLISTKMLLKERLIRYLSREFFDFEDPDLDLHKFHPQLRLILALNGIFFNNQNSKIRLIIPVINTSLSIVAIVMEIMNLTHGLLVGDFGFSTECFAYVMILGTVPVVYCTTLVNNDRIKQLLKQMYAEFNQVCNLGPRHRNEFLKGQLLIWQACHAWFAFCTVVITVMGLRAYGGLLFQVVFTTSKQVRPLVFPMWLPYDDPYRSPNYEVFLIIQTYVMVSILMSFVAYVYTLFHYLLHYSFIIDMILLDLQYLFEDLDENIGTLPKYDPKRMEAQGILNSRMERIVIWHNASLHAVKAVSSIYGPPLVYQISISGLVICFVGYQIAVELEGGTLNLFFIMLWSAGTIQVWIPCFLGTFLIDKALSISDACFNSGWHLSPLGSLMKQDLMIVTLVSHRPMHIRFTGLPMLTLETFSSIMSTAYSWFNMLRQSTE